MKTSASPRRWPFIAAFVLVIVLVESSYLIWSHFHEGHSHAHDHDDHGALVLTLNDGQRWETDEPLRLGMQRIRDAVALQMHEEHTANLTPAHAKALAATVQENVTYMIQNCQLAPAADTNLHVIINDLMAGASLLTTDGRSAEGAAKLTHALQAYVTFFDHPNWHPLPDAHS